MANSVLLVTIGRTPVGVNELLAADRCQDLEIASLTPNVPGVASCSRLDVLSVAGRVVGLVAVRRASSSVAIGVGTVLNGER